MLRQAQRKFTIFDFGLTIEEDCGRLTADHFQIRLWSAA